MRGKCLAGVLGMLLLFPASAAAGGGFGAPDPTFSGDGATTLSGGDDRNAGAAALTRTSDGGFVSGGSAGEAGVQQWALLKQDAAGAPVAGFGSAGKTLTPVGDSTGGSIARLIELPDGKLLAAGTARRNGATVLALARYSATGVLDPAFGIVYDPVSADGLQSVTALVRASDGDLLVAGSTRDGAATKAFVARFDAGGALDTGFGSGGHRLLALSTGTQRRRGPRAVRRHRQPGRRVRGPRLCRAAERGGRA